MQRSFSWSIFLLIIGLIPACSPLITETPPPPPQIIQIAYSTTMRPYLKKLHQCAVTNPGISLVTEETSMLTLEESAVDLSLWFGEPPGGIVGSPYSIGEDEIVFIIGKQVEIQNLDQEKIKVLYANPHSTYQMWIYSSDHELQSIFSNVIMDDISISHDVMVAPNPGAVVEAINANPHAIGFIPKSWLPNDFQSASIFDDLHRGLFHPIIVVSQVEPEGSIHDYLVCLQNINP